MQLECSYFWLFEMINTVSFCFSFRLLSLNGEPSFRVLAVLQHPPGGRVVSGLPRMSWSLLWSTIAVLLYRFFKRARHCKALISWFVLCTKWYVVAPCLRCGWNFREWIAGSSLPCPLISKQNQTTVSSILPGPLRGGEMTELNQNV